MAQTTDSLRLKVSGQEYKEQIDKLDINIGKLTDILNRYKNLQSQTASKVLGQSDSNLEQLQKAVNQNIQYVEGQIKMLQENRRMLEEQNNALGIQSQKMTAELDDAVRDAKSAANAIRIIADTVG